MEFGFKSSRYSRLYQFLFKITSYYFVLYLELSKKGL